MKKKNIIISIALLATLISVPSAVIYQAKAQENEINQTVELSERVNKVVAAINELEKISVFDISHKNIVLSTLYMFNDLTETEKAEIDSSLVEVLNVVVAKMNKIIAADDFDAEYNYLLNDPTFTYEEKLNELKEKYSAFDEETKGYIKSYSEENNEAIANNAKALTPDIYYDFTNATVSGNLVANKGTKSDSHATLKGNAKIEGNRLSFGTNSKTDQSCLELPSDMFSGATDFTFSVVYEKEVASDTNAYDLIFTFGNTNYHLRNKNQMMGLRASYASWSPRGPFFEMAQSQATNNSGEYGSGPHVYPADYSLHPMLMTIRYISQAQCLQVYERDLHTNMSFFFNYYATGTTYSHNEADRLTKDKFDIAQFTENYLGAKNGSSSGGRSFPGKYVSFRFYSRLVTDREMYGTDDRDLTIGVEDTLNYVNNFDKIGKTFDSYKNEYAKVIDTHYAIMVSCLYDYQKFFDPQRVEYVKEAYNKIHE